MTDRMTNAKQNVSPPEPELISRVSVAAVDIAGRRVEAITVQVAGLTLRADALSYRQVIAASRLARSHGAVFELHDSIARRLMIVPDEVREKPCNGPILATVVQLRKSNTPMQPGDVLRVWINGLVLLQKINDAADVAMASRLARSHGAMWDAPEDIAARYLRERCPEDS
ncbi:hypothetical protein VDS42_19020 [Xanthomonas campestris pv. campestris]|nr:hypothetical protein [Xanthomonas campestris pv. campestris]